MTCLEEDRCLLDCGLLEHVFVICCCCSVNALYGSCIARSSASLNAVNVNMVTLKGLTMLIPDENDWFRIIISRRGVSLKKQKNLS
jgi:hypothetical protein